MASSTLTTIRQRLIRELDLGLFIPSAKLDSAAAGSITSADMLRNSNHGPAHWSSRNTVIHRPGAASAADAIRFAGALTNTTGLLAHTGANYSDTTSTSETAELWRDGVRPDLEVLDAINRALEYVYYDTIVAISALSGTAGATLDGDMVASGTTAWTGSSGSTLSKIATSGFKTPFGPRALNIVTDSVNDYAQSSTLRVSPGRRMRAMAIGGVVSTGSVSLVGYDVSNSAAFGTAISSAEQEPVLLDRGWETVPSTCYQVALQLTGTAASATTVWNQVWVYFEDRLRIDLPVYVTEHFMAPQILRGRPLVQLANGVYNAQSWDFEELVEHQDYELVFSQPAVNPQAVLFTSARHFDYPLFIKARVPYSNLTTFSAETDATTAPMHLLMPRIKMEGLKSIYIPPFPP